MNFVSVRLVTPDVKRLVSFYERVIGVSPNWYSENFAEFATPRATLAIQSAALLQMLSPPKAGGAAIIEFHVADVDSQYAAAGEALMDVLQVPTTMPWGNRSWLFRDPDGNMVNLFTPVTPAAIARFADR